MKNYLLMLFALSICVTLQAQTSLQGKVTDAASGEPILFGTIALYKNDVLVTGTETDLDGNFFFSDVDPGSYDIEASYVGYTPQRQVGVVVSGGKSNLVNMSISEGTLMDEVVIVDYKVPLIEIDNTTSGGTVTSEQIQNLPTKSIGRIATTTSGVSSLDDGSGDINIRGSRSESTVYFVDGIRVSSAAMIPESEVEQLQVLTGGLPAEYGDVIGGAISVTSKGPSNRFSGGVELETSELFNDYGYNQFRGNVSGPILKNSEGKSILGFRFSAQYQVTDEDSPSAVGVYRASEDLIRQLEAAPFSEFGATRLPSPEFLTGDQFDLLSARPNDKDEAIDITGKIDARLSDAIDISISGSYDDNTDMFSPSREFEMFNWVNNPYNNTKGYRGSFRFRHKIGGSGSSTGTDEEKAEKLSTFRNAAYTIALGYQKRFGDVGDSRHGENLFNYGYYGSQVNDFIATPSPLSDPDNWDGQVVDIGGIPFAHQGYLEVDGEFTPNNDINGVLANYNTRNGTSFSPLDDVFANLYDNVGQVYDFRRKLENDRYTIDVSTSFDILPGGSEKGRHSFKFGVMYEQRINRQYQIDPVALWDRSLALANNHLFQGVNTQDSIGTFDFAGFTFTQYAPNVNADDLADNRFYRAARELTGVGVSEYFNISDVDPNDLSLDMFTPGELIDFTDLDLFYSGYDYKGNKLSGNVSFDDFFTGVDSEGIRTFEIAPQTPIYGAAYIQDKFTYKDLIFRLGVRVDYYDANTKVLKDPYSLYEIETASEFFARTGDDQPGSVGDDYSVYISAPDSDQVVGFRQGDQWFLPNGNSVSSGGALFGGGVVTPAIKGAAIGAAPNIQAPGFDTNASFEDYEAQVNVMPRISFSFPISEDAAFYAYYDVLYQRPTTNTWATALDYYFFEDPSRVYLPGRAGLKNNANLKPQKTVDYEIGFKQKLSNSTALSLSAYTRDFSNLIQFRTIRNTFPVSQYDTFDNLDFGTTTGFNIKYEMRRTNNIQFDVNYTMQFANGSGSDAESSRTLSSQGALRTLSALNFDERHAINATVDYRFGSGKGYDGPRIGDKDILANFGVNLLMRAASGRPYSQSRIVDQRGGSGFVGGINEARLPWNYSVDLQANKTFSLLQKKGGRPLNINIYFRVQNLFDFKNITGVYSFSGDASDDGYLVSSLGQVRLRDVGRVYETLGIADQQTQNFIDLYNYRALQPGFYAFPRRMYLGAMINF